MLGGLGALSLCFPSHWTVHVDPHTFLCGIIQKLCIQTNIQPTTCRYLQAQRNKMLLRLCIIKTKYRTFFCHLCSSPPSPLLLSTILHRSEATSSFCWSVRLRLGSCSWQAVLSDRLNSLYGTKACWSSSQYSRLHGTWEERHNNIQM